MTIKWNGMKEFKTALASFPKVAEKSLARTLYQEGETIMTDSKRNYTPWDLGALVNSGHVKKPTKKGTTLTVIMGYGGAASAYALAVHEYVDGSEDTSPASWSGGVTFQTGGPQYLKKPTDAARKRVLKKLDTNLAKDMRRVVR